MARRLAGLLTASLVLGLSLPAIAKEEVFFNATLRPGYKLHLEGPAGQEGAVFDGSCDGVPCRIAISKAGLEVQADTKAPLAQEVGGFPVVLEIEIVGEWDWNIRCLAESCQARPNDLQKTGTWQTMTTGYVLGLRDIPQAEIRVPGAGPAAPATSDSPFCARMREACEEACGQGKTGKFDCQASASGSEVAVCKCAGASVSAEKTAQIPVE